MKIRLSDAYFPLASIIVASQHFGYPGTSDFFDLTYEHRFGKIQYENPVYGVSCVRELPSPE